jgi:biopolymer transport protein TolQ
MNAALLIRAPLGAKIRVACIDPVRGEAIPMHASLLVKLVMALLIGISFMSWYWIFRKSFAIRGARSRTDKFELEFWSGGDLNALFQSAANDRHNAGGMERIFEAGYREFTKLRARQNMDTATVVDGARRAMRATYQREVDELESHLAFLASTGSVSPYIGLFGTVWGIMNAFRGLSNVGQATLAQVAPASPKRWSPPRSACSRPSRPWSPTTASPTTSTASRSAGKASWKSFPTSCSARHGKRR